MIWLPLQTLAQVSVERVLNALPEGILVAFFAWALLRVLRRQNSGTRFAVWFVALLMVAALPLLGGFPEGRVRMLAGMAAPASSSLVSMRPTFAIPSTWGLFIFLGWAVGAGVMIARLAVGVWRLRQLVRSCTPIVAADLDPALQETMDFITESGAVTVATSEGVRVPAAIGFWKRTIVLPAWVLGELAPNDLRAILLHEFAHLRRRDDLTNLVQKIVRAVFFFHPAVWWIESRLAVEREMACDDAVLAETANPHGYATCLVSLLEKSMAHRLGDKRWSMAHAAVRRAHEASLRLARILDTRRSTATRIWKPALAVMGIFSLLSLAALPRAPQLVAFDRGTAHVETGARYGGRLPDATTAKIETAKTTAAKITTAKVTAAKVVHAPGVARHQTAPAPVTARLNATQPSAPAIAINATANQEIAPQFETLVFIKTTQYGTSTLSVWSVQVWRVTFVVPRHDATGRVPAVNSI
jgi:beta-lactamase regulating signal transducer with metallopeptidase domain